jgi:hypothetical protein
MKRFNKFLLGELDHAGADHRKGDGKMAGVEEIKESEKKHKAKLEDNDHAGVIADVLRTLIRDNLHFDVGEEELIIEIARNSIINRPKTKELKDTKSWSTNALIKLFFKLKEAKKVEGDLK